MPLLDVNLDGDGAWPDLLGRSDLLTGAWTRLTALPAGMVSGRLSIGILVELPDGRLCFAETSWRLLYLAAKAIEARYGPPT